jgi:hypothetical protein
LSSVSFTSDPTSPTRSPESASLTNATSGVSQPSLLLPEVFPAEQLLMPSSSPSPPTPSLPLASFSDPTVRTLSSRPRGRSRTKSVGRRR